MAKILRYFMGANTPQGFVSRFDEMGDRRGGWRLTVLKGGPGTGKSTLMHRLSDAMARRSEVIEEIHCSSDADSLDGVIFPRHRLAIADGTPPHAIEPRYPGAYENIVSLCGCWDKDRLFACRGRIFDLTDRIALCHKESVSYLYGADALLGEVRAIAAQASSREKILRLAQRLAKNEIPRGEGAGTETIRLLSAVTNKGTVCFTDTVAALAPRLYVIDDPWGFAAPELLAQLRRLLLEAGHDVVTCVCPMAPFTRIDHLLAPGLGLGFVTRNKFHLVDLPAYRVIHARRFADMEQLAGHKMRIKLLHRAAQNMLEQASARIAAAKVLHDDLEACFKDAMDYGQVEGVTGEVIAQFLKDSQ